MNVQESGTDVLSSKTESATNARKDFFKILDQVVQDSSVVVVKRKNAPNVAILAESELRGLVEAVHLLRSRQNAARLFSALEKSDTHDLDTPEFLDSDRALAELRQYCEQTEAADRLGVTLGNKTAKISNF